MLCDWCKKNEATIHIQEIVGSEKKSVHICGACAAEKAHDKSGMPLGPFNLAEMLYNLTAKHSAAGGEPRGEADDRESGKLSRCPRCAWSIDDLRKKGRLGCPFCYEYFKPILAGALANMHRGELHVGKRPGEVAPGSDADVSRLRLELLADTRELEAVISREEYERAAVLRDRIAEIKQRLAELENPPPKKKAAPRRKAAPKPPKDAAATEGSADV